MKTLKRFLVLAGCIILAAAVLVFVLENQAPVDLVIFGWPMPALPVAGYMAAAFLVGMLIGPLIGWFFYGRLRLKVASQQRELDACRRRLADLDSAQASARL